MRSLNQLCLFLALAVATGEDTSTCSLSNDDNWKLLRTCAAQCIWGTCCISVADSIGCPSPWYNQCVCNLNQQSSAAAHVSSCVVSKCTGNADVSSAVAVYTDYCASAGYALATAVATAPANNDLSTVNLFQDNEFETLRSCAQQCIWGTCCISVADFIGCPSPWYNQCVCNLNQQSLAAAHVSSCVVSRCTGNSDVSTAVAVYINYCASAGYVLANTQQSSGGVTTVTGMQTRPLPTASKTVSPNQPSTTHETVASTDAAGSSGSRYSTSDKIALGVGIGIGTPTLIATIWQCYRLERRLFG